MSILVGIGTGRSAPPTSETPDDDPFDLATVDLNGDGLDDLVAAVPGRDEVVAMVGNGNATFTKATYAVCDYPIRLAVADLDGDGDVVASSKKNASSVIMRNLCDPWSA